MSQRMDGSAICRTIIVTQHCPPAMRKRDVWRVDQFHLLKKVGSGYASTVYLGTCRTSGNQMALKLYHKNKLSELNHFQVAREITIHSALDHKNIIQMWAAFEDQYGIYLVFEYASKGDVFTEVERRGGQLNEAESVRQVIHPFLSALDYLHSNYIIHRDIKPENLLFTATGVLKVGDFGLSINFSQERPVTRVGTLDYMAPEVVVCPDKHKPQDHKEMKHLCYTPLVDAWAVGVLAYELIVGRPPFDRGQKKATIGEILNGEPFIPPWLSEGATHFIKWALTKEQAKRPSVQQLAEHPWILSHMRQGAPVMPRRQLVKTDSFVEPRQLGFRGSNVPAHAEPHNSGREPPRPLQVSTVAATGRFLGHSNSMSAMDGMRYRDVHVLDSVSNGMASAAEAALASVKRVSDGDGTTGGRPSAAGGRVSRAGTARNSGAGGVGSHGLSLSRMNSINSRMAAAAAAAVAAVDAEMESLRAGSSNGRPMSRDDLRASLTSPAGTRSPTLMRSFTAGRAGASTQQQAAQAAALVQALRMSGGGGPGVSGSPVRSASPLARSTVAADIQAHHYQHQHSPLSANSVDSPTDASRLRTMGVESTGPGQGSPHSPSKLSVTSLRPQPPAAPSPTARGLKSGSPLIPSRLSQSFTSPVSPLAASGGLLQPSRLGMDSNPGGPGTPINPGGGPGTHQASQADLPSASNGGSAASPRSIAPSIQPALPATTSGSLSGRASPSPGPSPRELPGERSSDLEEELNSSHTRDSEGSSSRSLSKSKGLFGSIKKVFS